MGSKITLSISPLLSTVSKTNEDASEPSTPSHVLFEIEIEEDQDMPQQPLNPLNPVFCLVSPFSALSILGAYAVGQTQEQVQEIMRQIAATLQRQEQEFWAHKQQLQARNEQAWLDINRLRVKAHQ